MINYPNYFSSYFENFKKLFNEIDQKRLENLYLALKKVEKEWVDNDFNLNDKEIKNLINKYT